MPLLLILALLSAAPVLHAATEDEQILLRAGDITVTGQDLQQQLLLLTDAERAQVLAGPDKLRGYLRLIYQDKRMTAAAEQLGLDRTPRIQARLITERRRVLAAALRDHTKTQLPPPDFAALAREQYAVRRDEFQLPEQFKAAHILKRVQCDCEREEKRQSAEQLLARLRAGEDFATLAKTESDDTSTAAQGGDLGRWMKREQLVTPFADALVKLDIGALSDIVQTEFGFHLIKKLDYQPVRQQSFEEVQGRLEQNLRQSYVKDQLEQRAYSYLPPADATFDEPALETLLRDTR
ncbi:MAG: peptidylprolyl isomerase [Candidatus Contendobacter sp.]|jgi:peptidyl-prolyl cis-trans isomerase C|nr:peptidylprolyl isomerase [Candidatus Contendobacter sp.]